MRMSKARRACVSAMMKETILVAASSVLEQHGLDGLTMNRVAATAELGTASLYTYFRNKDELLQFVYSKLVEPFFQAMEAVCHSELLAIQKLRKILDTSCEYAVKHKGLIRFLAAEDQAGRVRRKTHPRSLRLVTTVFEEGIRDGSLRPLDPAHAGRMFQGFLSELFELQQDGASSDEMNKYVEAAADAMRRSFSLGIEQSPKPEEASPRPSNP